ncbi:MAG TPA: PilZ domain-containing protein [Firmicutes bacterium]|nr:PilZ domain-containing protein [Bacillota bacterium]
MLYFLLERYSSRWEIMKKQKIPSSRLSFSIHTVMFMKKQNFTLKRNSRRPSKIIPLFTEKRKESKIFTGKRRGKIDLKNIKEFLITCGDKEYRASLTEEKGNNLIFQLLPQSPPTGGEIRKRGEVSFYYQGKKYLTYGMVYCIEARKITFIMETGFIEERRKETRVKTSALPAKIIEIKRFRPDIINASIIDISRSGARIETRSILNKQLPYIIEGHLITGHFHQIFQAVFKIKNCEEIKGLYLYGIHFEEISPENQKKIDKFLIRVKGKWGKDALNY